MCPVPGGERAGRPRHLSCQFLLLQRYVVIHCLQMEDEEIRINVYRLIAGMEARGADKRYPGHQRLTRTASKPSKASLTEDRLAEIKRGLESNDVREIEADPCDVIKAVSINIIFQIRIDSQIWH